MSAQLSGQRHTDRKVYRLAHRFLGKFEAVTPEILEQHLSVPECERPDTMSGLYHHLVFTAQNYQSLPQVIGCRIGGVAELEDILCGFEPAEVLDKYGEDGWRELLDDVDARFFPGDPRRREPGSLWPRFCRAALSGASFLVRFQTTERFYAWVARYDRTGRSRYRLVSRVAERLHGFGEALACDFIKELGFANWSKPDVHLKKIFVGLGLAADGGNETVFRAIARFARNVGVSPYHADKIFWLISSGRFYHAGFEIGRHRDRFIRYAAKRLGL